MEPDNKNNEAKPETKPIVTSTPEPKKHVLKVEPHIALVETYAADMADAIGGDAGSVVKKIIHSEENAKPRKKIYRLKREKTGFLFLPVSFCWFLPWPLFLSWFSSENRQILLP